ncbi:hypothetical protein UO65_1470 [Actinokineospora spheciospongiae]|uniref:Integral membrane protein n=1 Tax=Actinokineospora spheciospongiae TaxID=909613 RepID=W7J2U4_9PSEU|nr:AI-2E family transporter [Actinokineospora spheciospongiae]EWC63256.1 hypothetical protein UO65_1470 [Actinokineospora spheciospongiae]PWW66914.1 putative PurR-regulated permease PerM [Actinokineospora spheciospongiae]
MRATLNAEKTRTVLRNSARVSLDVLLLLAVTVVVLWVVGRMWSVVWPLVIALLLTTLTWPVARFLRGHRWRPALAASVVTVLFLLVAAGIGTLIVLPVVQQAGDLSDGVVAGIQRVREWAAGPPLNIADEQVSSALDSGIARIKDSAGDIANATVTGVGAVASGLLNAVLAIFLMFFFLKDGPRFLPWLTRQLPGRLATHVPAVTERCWVTLGSFVRSQALVGLLDAVFIGIGLWIVGVPLVLPLAVLTFVSAFVPIVGALFAGAVAVLIALVSNGLTDALIVLAIIVVVQQLEGNVFQPIIQSESLGLHAAVVLLAVTLGGSLAGITGSLLAVPVAAMIAVVWNHVRDRLSDPEPAAVDPGTAVDSDAEPVAKTDPA